MYLQQALTDFSAQDTLVGRATVMSARALQARVRSSQPTPDTGFSEPQPVHQATTKGYVAFTFNDPKPGLVSVNSTASITNTAIAILPAGYLTLPPILQGSYTRGSNVRPAAVPDMLAIHASGEVSRLALDVELQPITVTKPKGHLLWLARALANWGLTTAEVKTLLGLGSEQEVTTILDGQQPATGRDLVDRLRLLLEIDATLGSVLRDDENERSWLREPNEGLGATPLSYMLDGSMRNLIVLKEYLDQAAGR